MSEEKESVTAEPDEIVSPAADEKNTEVSSMADSDNLESFHLDMERLLIPIPGDNPAGEFLRYEETYDRIKGAREEETDLPQGVWERPLKKADWSVVSI